MFQWAVVRLASGEDMTDLFRDIFVPVVQKRPLVFAAFFVLF